MAYGCMGSSRHAPQKNFLHEEGESHSVGAEVHSVCAYAASLTSLPMFNDGTTRFTIQHAFRSLATEKRMPMHSQASQIPQSTQRQ